MPRSDEALAGVSFKFFKRFKECGLRQGWWDAPRVLAAVSGGSDSVALLDCLDVFFPGEVCVAHFEHGIRGASSRADAVFVAELARGRGLLFLSASACTPEEREKGESLEVAARRLRYAFFERAAAECGIEYIATGHTADDQAETVLLNLFRGCGVRGLAGIPELRETRAGHAEKVKIVRPLIGFTREELRAHLAARGIAWREDETNAENDYTRNRLRNELIPWVKEHVNRTVVSKLCALAEECARFAESDRARAGEALAQVASVAECGTVFWQREKIGDASPELIAEMIREQGRRLRLRALDRRRTELLARLVMRKRGSKRWRFQWQGTTEVRDEGKLIAWRTIRKAT